MKPDGVDGGDLGGVVVVSSSTLGRNVELMSPIPTKKSSRVID